ncbi:MAG: endolytic transglycosylase MltG [Alphaproteobacteria bacterium]
MSYKFKKFCKKQVVQLFWLIMLLLGALIVLTLLIGRSGDNVYQLNVASGASVSAIADDLKKNDIIDSVSSFKLAVRAQGGKIQIGQYDIKKGTSAWKIAKMLAKGNVAITKIVIPEGLTIKQVKSLLASDTNLSGDVDCIDGGLLPVCDLQDGDIFPDTYKVARGTQRLAVLDLARKKMLDVKKSLSQRRFPSPLKNWNNVLTLASIVQKETPRESEMPIVASVYLNRLKKNMRLQADPTVVYAITDGLGDMRGQPLLTGHLKIEHPYNTYRNNGLPPAPIANVGRAAIKAVLKPADTNYLFFVADGNGGHKFSNSYEEHLENHAKWREIKQIRNQK